MYSVPSRSPITNLGPSRARGSLLFERLPPLSDLMVVIVDSAQTLFLVLRAPMLGLHCLGLTLTMYVLGSIGAHGSKG